MTKRVRLSEVAEFINGRAFKPEEWETEGLPIIRIQNLTGSTDTINYYSGDVEPKYLVKDDDILISWSASLGVYWWKGGDAILNQHIFKVELKEKLIDKEYFYYAAQNALVEMKNHVHGATMQHITRDPFLAIEIPLPPLTEQKRIASLLARADRLRQLRRTAHDLGDALLQSVFLEMFGDPISLDSKWKTVSLRSHIELIGGYGFESSEFAESGIPVIRIGTVNSGSFSNSNLVYLPETYIEKYKNVIIYPGDLVITMTGTVGKDDYGNVCKLGNDFPLYFLNQRVTKLDFDHKMFLPSFIQYAFGHSSIRNSLTGFSRGIRQANIANEDIYCLNLIVPPLSLQEEFAGVVARVESLRGRMGESTRQVEGLFESLLAESFGEKI